MTKTKITQDKLCLNKEEIFSMHNLGRNTTEIANQFNIPIGSLRRYLKRHGLKLNDKCIFRKYQLNEEYFNIIDSQEKAYWLGWLMSDGNVFNNRISLVLQLRDIKILEMFKHSINSGHPIKIFTIKTGFGIGKKYASLSITSKKMAVNIKNHGVIPNKSLILKYPNNLDDKYLLSLLHGYIDGDGCLCIYKNSRNNKKRFKLSFLSSKYFVFDIIEKLKKYGWILNSYHSSKHHKDVFEASTQNKKWVIEILRKIYENNFIGLERKYNKYLEMEHDFAEYPVNESYVRYKKCK